MPRAGPGLIGGRVVLDDVFPADGDRHYPASRYVASTSADRQGRYRFEALPPADYYVAAANRGRVNVARQLDDAEFLESLVAGASRVSLADGAHVSVQVKLADR
ncbi:MAG TPA: hypothetical protein VNG89_26385 [Vicinamibacterales bacterium]|nr:hypothetical protein [Vicinamibacterales bacterium]